MAIPLQLRRGTTAQHTTFTGTVGEVTVDTDKDTLIVHDGITAGGFQVARTTKTSTDNAIARFDGTTGAIQNSGVVIGDSGKFTNGLLLPNTTIANATTLDWYEEGTFIPTIVGATTAGVGTHSIQYGKFTRIGDRVHIHFRVVWSAHTGTGNMTIGGLPFAANAEVGTFATNNLCALSGDLTYSGGALGVYIAQGASALTVCTLPVSTGVVGLVAMDTASTLFGSITYRV